MGKTDMENLIATQYFWPEHFCVNNILKGLREKGHDIVILTGIPNYPADRWHINKIN